MNLFKELILNEVYPALGCTEPIACAYAASLAAKQLNEKFIFLKLKIDPGTYKNGASVVVPNTGGKKGNLIAAVLGALSANPEEKLMLLNNISTPLLKEAMFFLENKNCSIECLNDYKALHIEVELISKAHSAYVILDKGHTNIELIKKDTSIIFINKNNTKKSPLLYRKFLKNLTISEIFDLAENLDKNDLEYLNKGIKMNLDIASKGIDIDQTASFLKKMNQDKIISDDLFYRCKLLIASAVDARMAGINMPVMTSGGSGNQGIVAILVPYKIGKELNINEKTILKSIAISHLINGYVKCHIGELSSVCGCALSAGIAAAIAIVYQQDRKDVNKIHFAVNNVIGDLGGMLCDGAKASCAMKSITAVDSAIRSGMMALKGYGLPKEGLLSDTIENTIKNLKTITLEGMLEVDPTLIKIMKNA